MITVSFCFPHHVSRQVELRSACAHVGSPVTASLGFAAPPKLVELLTVCDNPGSPVTETIAFSPPLTFAELHSSYDRVGSPVSTACVFTPSSSIRTEWRSALAQVGSPVTARLAFALPPTRSELRSIHRQAGNPVAETFVFPKLLTQNAFIRWSAQRKTYTTATICFQGDYHNLTTSPIVYCYGQETINGTALRYRHWSVVKPGWRIVARNIVTGESFELGFIDTDAENPVLEGIFLPDGDYEITVLTSSLFWKDCIDREIRTISTRPGEEITPLPTIYNLRSAVLEGVSTIRWSANQSELDDCVFGVWYDSQSPVDINRPPDATVWYYSSQTEYATTFSQNAPAHVAVAAMRTGNEPETGKVHELYLDWSNVPPRCPDDVVVLNAPLPAFDETVGSRHKDDPFWSLWGG